MSKLFDVGCGAVDFERALPELPRSFSMQHIGDNSVLQNEGILS